MDQQPIRVLVVDDHPMVRKGLAATIDPEPDMKVVASAATGQEAVDLFREQQPDVTIMDLGLTQHMTGIQAIQAIRSEFAKARIIVLSAHKGDEDIFRALRAGAVTFLLKETLGDDLIPIIREVHAGGGPIPPYVARKLADRVTQAVLTKREIQVLQLMAKGLRNKEIAGHLGISLSTIEGHIKNILTKLNVHGRTEAVAVAIQRNLVHLD